MAFDNKIPLWIYPQTKEDVKNHYPQTMISASRTFRKSRIGSIQSGGLICSSEALLFMYRVRNSENADLTSASIRKNNYSKVLCFGKALLYLSFNIKLKNKNILYTETITISALYNK